MFYIIGAILLAFIFLFLFRWSGWKRDIQHQIDIYNELRAQLPDANESNLASRLLKMKIRNESNRELRAGYDNLSKQGGLTLKTALYFIIEYEYIRARGLNPTDSGPQIFLQKVKEHIDMQIT